ncbi:hypothetical protein CANARDRAFT_26701 [[Candida] arabinofermentans NRRL YB-2248]|uniref:Dipeptidyl aminopeptidase A n=1 Tax=[Candida] arabinofermentans NRRL YB-2248 TaxID=983967 RepID=A0A1E4T6A2_9ASCO|nr:hypothetical protein CANARDRAFT_26701 [[Candida] arabinofermentans NRRL YB-2248]
MARKENSSSPSNSSSSSDSRFDRDIELQIQNSRRNSAVLEGINQFSIDDDDNEDIVYSSGPGGQHIPLNTSNGAPITLKQKIYALLSSRRSKKMISIFTIITVLIWLLMVLMFARKGQMSNTNLYHPNVGSSSDAYDNVTLSNNNNNNNNHTLNEEDGGIVDPDSTDLKKMSLDDERLGLYYVFGYDLSFVDIAGSTTANDEGYYIHRSGQSEILKKASDDSYELKLYNDNSMTYNGHAYTIYLKQLSSDLKKAIVVADATQEWRHSSFARYFILDIETDTIEPVYTTKKNDIPKLSFAKFSPKFNYVTFVYEHNIYMKKLSDGTVTQITSDGSDSISNGKPDWVYEEEVLASGEAIYWCPDESHFAYIKFDDTNVPTYNLEFFKDEKYPTIEDLKYPKPGYDNPIVEVNVYNLADKSTDTVSHTDSKLGKDFVVYQVSWITKNQLLIKETNRQSRLVDVRLFDTSNKSSKIVRTINTDDYDGWYLNNGNIYVLPDSVGGYIDSVVVDYRDHLGYFATADTKEPKILTSGEWDVMSGVLGYNDKDGVVYFIGTAGNALERHVYQVGIEAGVKSLKSLDDLKLVSSYSLRVSAGGKYGYLTYSGPSLPDSKLVDLSKLANDTDEYDNSESLIKSNQVEDSLKNYQVPVKEYKQVTLDDGTSIDVIEVRPYNFDASKKYPLLVSVYGGPGSQKLSSEFSYYFDEIVSSSLESVVWYIDPRGTGGRGWKYKSFAKDKIGYWEPRDITEATKKLISEGGYIDESKTAIWGWSYGGFTTLKTLEYDHGDVFKYGMAVAPVTNWLLYDSIYTERYMDLPSNNAENYEKNSQITDINAFKNVERFLIMHGTGDDNVHFQNTLHLVDKFDLHTVENYDMFVFPDSNHNIAYNNANTIVYDKLFNWLEHAFEGMFD